MIDIPSIPIYSSSTGSFGTSRDLPSLDLAFALDKTLTARRGPTPVFTRSSGNNRGTTYFGPSSINAIFTLDGNNYNVDVVQSTLLNGRYRWENGDTQLSYTGTAWLLSQDGNTVATSAPTSAFRPDGAIWSGTAAVVTATSTFGIVRAADNEPRFDHDPVTFACKGLLIEGEGRNLLPRSNELNVTPWVPATVTRSQVIKAGLDGGPAWLLVPTGTDSSLGQTHTVASSVPHTFSVYLKSDTGANVSISLSVYDNTAGTNRGVKFITITPQWQRFDITTSTVVAGNSTAFLIGAFGSWTTGENILAWGAQLEVGSFPTSYIPTTTTALTRSADVCSITGEDFTSFYNPSEGTLFTECQAPTANQYAGIAVIGTTSYNHNIALFKSDTTGATVGNRFVPYVTQSGSLMAKNDFGTESGNGNLKVLASVALNNMIFARNGTLSPVDSSATMPTPNRITIGGRSDGNYLNGHIARIQYFKKRLPDAKLQSLTTP